MANHSPPHAPPPRLAALRSRDYRLLWLGQMVSTIGSQMTIVAVNWQVYRLLSGVTVSLSLGGQHLDLNGQALGLGSLGLARVGPIILFALLGGVLADTYDRRRLVMTAQAVSFMVSALLAGITFSGHAGLAAIYTLSAMDAAVGAFEGPAQEALAPQLVPREHLTNAASLNTLVWTLATIAGPALAGVVIAVFSVGAVYSLDAISFLVALTAVAGLRYRGKPRAGGAQVGWHSLVEGLKFTRGMKIIWGTMLLDFWATFFSSARTMLPIVADRVLHSGVQGYGLLATAQPLGAVLAGAVLALRRDLRHQGVVLLIGVAVYGVTTALFGLSSIFALSYLLFGLTGAGDMVSTVIRSAMRQTLTPDELRGRLSSVHMIMAFGGPQIGEMEAGLVAAMFGVAGAIVTGGLLTVALTGYVAARYPGLRRYEVRHADRAS
jgi:MFS family permease